MLRLFAIPAQVGHHLVVEGIFAIVSIFSSEVSCEITENTTISEVLFLEI